MIPLLVSTIIGIITYYDPNMEQYKLIKDAMAIEPAIDYLVRKLEPSTAGCANYECAVNLALSSYLFLTILTVYCTILLLMFIVYVRQFRVVRAQLTSSAVRLNQMLFYALVCQALLTLLFIILPLFVMNLSMIWQLRYGSLYAQLTFFYGSIHTPLEILSTLFVIKPYRTFILDKIALVPGLKKLVAKPTKIFTVVATNTQFMA